jgi:hypothetical protein
LETMSYREKCLIAVRNSLDETARNMDKRIASGKLSVAIAEAKLALSIIVAIVSNLDDNM